MDLASNVHAHVELLAHLPPQTVVVVFALLDLAAWKLPVPGQMRAGEAFGHQDPVRPLDDRRHHDHPLRSPRFGRHYDAFPGAGSNG